MEGRGEGAPLIPTIGRFQAPGPWRSLDELAGRAPSRVPAEFAFGAADSDPGISRRDGGRAAFGRPLRTQYDFRAAAVVLALDSDFLAAGPFTLRYARHFSDGRRVVEPTDPMNRLYAVEGRVSVTGSSADHRLRCPSDEVETVARAVLAEVLRAMPTAAPPELAAALGPWLGHAAYGRWALAVARDLGRHPGGAIVIAGERQPAAVHAIAHTLNALLGNAGKTVYYTEPPILEAGEPSHGLGRLVDELAAGEVETLVIVEGNPSYTAPADLELSRKIRALERTVYLGLHENETARDCAWFIPAAHYLESWGDARAADGTISLVQPLIVPLYGGKTASQLLAAFLGDGAKSPYELLREFWQKRRGSEGDFEAFWQETLSRGVNRCVGTRFCSNNCPYKVRRFNWFNYNQEKSEVERMAMNPDVTVRDRGVMEKCTYCVQRIREAEIRALRARTASDPLLLPQELQRVEGRAIRDGEFQTACQQACPTRAIVFGSLGDPASSVSHLRRSKRSYSELGNLGAVPRTQYLARLFNRNPELT